MKLHIDISVFSSSHAFGNVTGDFEFPSVPEVGDKVFLFNQDGVRGKFSCPDWLKVASVIAVPANGEDAKVVGLDDLVCDSRAEAQAICEYLESKWDLFYVVYGT